MKRKPKQIKEPAGRILRDLFRQPAADFYAQPMLHINCYGQVQVENCREILLYDSSQIRLDMGRWEVTLYGDGLELCAASRGQLLLRGRVLRTEFSYKEGQ
ncbi:MAG: YabP/YqfC family sporulation protein [Fournierella sp.]|uniref:YabP/YqfC family sporulation protein n=1 Tax=Allofournierella sp. TaxID=1940256 RepID=UPI0025C468D9|nr:YabP/YqfC family sporulation protein [Fournierella sp.]MDY4168236.1 YabP/YqfC family sporulation protein [Fournierella sp.]